MVEEISNPVTRRCNTGKMPAWMRKMKSQNNYSCDELASAVTGMVKDSEEELKKQKLEKEMEVSYTYTVETIGSGF